MSNRHHSHICAHAIVPSFLLIVFISLWPIYFSSCVTVSYLDTPLLHNRPSIASQLLWFCHTMIVRFPLGSRARLHFFCHLCSTMQSGANIVTEMESTLHMPWCPMWQHIDWHFALFGGIFGESLVPLGAIWCHNTRHFSSFLFTSVSTEQTLLTADLIELAGGKVLQ